MQTVNKLWLLLALMAGFAPHAGAVEVVVNGVQYPSMVAYKASKERGQTTAGLSAKTTLTPVSSGIAKLLNSIGYEDSVKNVKDDFEQNRSIPTVEYRISANQLGDRLEELLDGRPDPLMVVAESNKLRVVELDGKPTSR